jgi:hypothetical protein
MLYNIITFTLRAANLRQLILTSYIDLNVYIVLRAAKLTVINISVFFRYINRT